MHENCNHVTVVKHEKFLHTEFIETPMLVHLCGAGCAYNSQASR